METKKVKTKLIRLFRAYEGPKMERYKSMAKDLHIKLRTLQYLITGEKPASFYVAREIDSLLEKKDCCSCGSKKIPTLNAPVKGFTCQDCGKRK